VASTNILRRRQFESPLRHHDADERFTGPRRGAKKLRSHGKTLWCKLRVEKKEFIHVWAYFTHGRC